MDRLGLSKLMAPAAITVYDEAKDRGRGDNDWSDMHNVVAQRTLAWAPQTKCEWRVALTRGGAHRIVLWYTKIRNCGLAFYARLQSPQNRAASPLGEEFPCLI